MLGRYRMLRGKRPPEDPLPVGIRMDTRKHTKHLLRPSSAAVADYLADPTDSAWGVFEREYLARLEERFADEPEAFAELAELARQNDVFLGCSCPTSKNPDVRRCHTVVALKFMKRRFPDLEVRFPDG